MSHPFLIGFKPITVEQTQAVLDAVREEVTLAVDGEDTCFDLGIKGPNLYYCPGPGWFNGFPRSMRDAKDD